MAVVHKLHHMDICAASQTYEVLMGSGINQSDKSSAPAEKPVSLRPLTVEQALGDMLKVKPPPEKPRRGGKKVAFRNANKQEG